MVGLVRGRSQPQVGRNQRPQTQGSTKAHAPCPHPGWLRGSVSGTGERTSQEEPLPVPLLPPRPGLSG